MHGLAALEPALPLHIWLYQIQSMICHGIGISGSLPDSCTLHSCTGPAKKIAAVRIHTSVEQLAIGDRTSALTS